MPMSISVTERPHFTRAGLRRGVLGALPFLLSNGVAGLVIGVAYHGEGLGFASAVSFSLFVYSGTAQAVTLGMWTAQPQLAALAVAVVATNARYLVMGAHLRQLFGGLPKRVMAPILFLLADASWLMTTADAADRRPDAGFLLGSSLPMAAGWVGGTALGAALEWQPVGPLAAAAVLLPLAFIVALLPTQWRGLRSIAPWSVAAITALLAVDSVGQGWAMLAGGATGTAVAAMRGHDD